jgi:hypothetical protein
MWGRILDRMVEHAIPPDVENPEQERIAEEAAENAIRHTLSVAGIAGVILFAAFAAALLYGLPPSQQIVQAPPKAAGVTASVDVDDAKLRLAKEEAERKLDQVTIDRDKLQSKVADLARQVAEAKQSQPTKAAALPQDTSERNRLQGKVADLERQVADLTKTLQATKKEAVPENTAPMSKATTGPTKTPAVASARGAYQCGDGRTVRNPAACRAASTAPAARAEESRAEDSIPSIYYCGDGRSVPNPAACRAATLPGPRG